MYAAALIDSHPILRLGLARILGNIDTIREVRIYDPEYLAATTLNSESGLPVQILLFGLTGDPVHDQELFERMVHLVEPKSALLLAEHARDPGVTHPLVSGRVKKSASSELIEAAVRLIIAGGRCFPAPSEADDMTDPVPGFEHSASSQARNALDGWPSPSAIAASARSLRITPRQFEILILRARGFSHKTVGQMLNISEATVKAHASAMYRRLDVSTRQEAVKMATERGIHFLLPPNSSDETTPRR